MTAKTNIRYWLFIMAFAVMSSLMSYKSAEAASEYEIIYNDAVSYGGTYEEAEWLSQAILYASSTYGVDPLLIAAVMRTESGYNVNAISSAGAIGLMQLMPGTAAAIGINPYNPLENIVGGTIYLRNQLDNFSGWGEYAVTDAVAAYNAGSGAIYQYGGVPPYAETRNYVVQVADSYAQLTNLLNR